MVQYSHVYPTTIMYMHTYIVDCAELNCCSNSSVTDMCFYLWRRGLKIHCRRHPSLSKIPFLPDIMGRIFKVDLCVWGSE